MTTQAISVPRPEAGFGDGPRGGGFGSLLRAEWIKFRSVRGWVIGMILAALLTIFLGVFAAANANIGCQINGGPPKSGKACLPYIPHGPGGEIVTDSFSFVRQPLTGNGTITVRVTSLTGEHANLSSGPVQVGNGNMVPGLAEWAKAGIIIKQSTHQGSAYTAMMVTDSHGVRMQYNFTGDTAGMPGAVSAAHPRWLRLTRSGDTITGYDSADGTHWTQVGTVQLTGLPSTVQVGMFATSPGYTVTQNSFGGASNDSGPAQATGAFDHVSLAGGAPGSTWTGTAIGGGGPAGAGPGPGRRRLGAVHPERRQLHADGLWRHRARHAGARRRAPDGDDRAEPGGRVPGADRDRGGGGDVLQHRVPARPHPYHAGRHPAPRRGAGRQGRGDRRGGLRHRAGGRGGLDRRRCPEGGEFRVRYC